MAKRTTFSRDERENTQNKNTEKRIINIHISSEREEDRVCERECHCSYWEQTAA